MKRAQRISAHEAALLVKDGDVLMAGGFGMTGSPVHLLHALAETRAENLTYVGNNVGEAGLGGGRLRRNGQLTKAIGSCFTSDREAVRAWRAVSAGNLVYRMTEQNFNRAMSAGRAWLGVVERLFEDGSSRWLTSIGLPVFASRC